MAKQITTIISTIVVVVLLICGLWVKSLCDAKPEDVKVIDGQIMVCTTEFDTDICTMIQTILSTENKGEYYTDKIFTVTGEVYMNSVLTNGFITLGCDCDTCIYNYVLFNVYSNDNGVLETLAGPEYAEGNTITLTVYATDVDGDGCMDYQVIDV